MKLALIIYLFIAEGVFTFAGQLAPQVVIPVALNLSSSVVVNSAKVTMGQIVQKCVGYEKFCKSIVEAEIADAPEPGKSFSINHSQINSAIIEKWPNISLTISPAASVVIRSDFDTVPLERVKREINNWLKQHQIPGWYVEAVQVNSARNFRVRPGDFTLEVEPLWEESKDKFDDAAEYLSSRQVNVNYTNIQTKEQINLQFSVSFSLEKDALCAKRNLTAGSAVTEEDYFKCRQRIRSFAGELDSFEEVRGQVLRAHLHSGQILKKEQFSSPIVVKRGEEIKIVVKNGFIEIKSAVKALEDGRLGEVISVQYEKTKKNVKASVVGPKKVELEKI